MSIRKIVFTEGGYYHVYNRGNSKQKIFLDHKDYKRFMDLLYAVNSPEKFNFSDSEKGISIYEQEREHRLVAIGAYCLMPNHFHILITPLTEQGLTKFMQKLSTAYVMYFNEKYNRTGALFEGKFKAEHLNKDTYLKYIFSYIHLNPIKLIQKDWKEVGLKNKPKALEYLKTYIYSSFIDYLGKNRVENIILSKPNFPNYFPNIKDFIEEILTWINFESSSTL
jgi:putative transposase